MGKKATHKGKGYFATYKTRGVHSSNKKRKIVRHLKAHPEDKQAAGIDLRAFKWTRTKPGVRIWKGDKSKMATAALLSKLGYTPEEIKYECFIKKPKNCLNERQDRAESQA